MSKIEHCNSDLNTEELKAKRANADRIKEFSKKLDSYNKEQIKSTRREDDGDTGTRLNKAEVKSSREKALEFAKNVPKPKLRPRELVAQEPKASEDNGYGSIEEENCVWNDDGLGEFADLIGGSRLQELQTKHGENRKKADAIKRSLGLA